MTRPALVALFLLAVFVLLYPAASRGERQPTDGRYPSLEIPAAENVHDGTTLGVASGTDADVLRPTPRAEVPSYGASGTGLVASDRRTRGTPEMDPRRPVQNRVRPRQTGLQASQPPESHQSASVRPQTASRASGTGNAAADGSRRGVASWYAYGPGLYAAMPGYRDGTRVVAVVTSIHDGRAYSVTVPVVTQCGCYVGTPDERLIDLSPSAFSALGWPLSKGIAPVQVQIVEGELRP